VNARLFSIVNAVGCLLLAGFILIQWQGGTRLEEALQTSRREAADERKLRTEAEKRAAGLGSDIEGLKASIDSIRKDAADQIAAAKAQMGQSEELHKNLVLAQEQLKLMQEAIKTRDEALKVRDEKLKEYGDALTATRKRLDEAIAKLKEAR
jgi:chromosome segregation ATPase